MILMSDIWGPLHLTPLLIGHESQERGILFWLNLDVIGCYWRSLVYVIKKEFEDPGRGYVWTDDSYVGQIMFPVSVTSIVRTYV